MTAQEDREDQGDRRRSTPASAPSRAGERRKLGIPDRPGRGGGEVFRDKVLVLSLLRQDRRLFVGTGMTGQLFEVDEATREKSEIARLDHGQILGLLRKKDGSIVVATGDPGKLYTLEDRYTASGTITSEVLDAKLVSKWGRLRWQARTPDLTSVSVAVRSGNVSEPDETWSDWSEEQTDGDEAKITSPAARYLQYRITLLTQDSEVTPASLDSLTLRYATTNQAPEVTKIEVPDVNATNLENGKKLKLKWTATDANEDDLRYRLQVKKDGWDRWVELVDDYDGTDYEWDTTTTPSGVYRLKVVASDSVDNPEKEALTGERISEPFVVCHTAAGGDGEDGRRGRGTNGDRGDGGVAAGASDVGVVRGQRQEVGKRLPVRRTVRQQARDVQVPHRGAEAGRVRAGAEGAGCGGEYRVGRHRVHRAVAERDPEMKGHEPERQSERFPCWRVGLV